MRRSPRLTLSVLAGVAVAYLSTIPLALLVGMGGAAAVLQPFVSIAAGVLAGRFLWRRLDGDDAGLAASAGVGALVLGGIGFAGGFFGPMLLAPGANQGPLLGLFITGPGGVVLGDLGGAVWWARRRRARRHTSEGRAFRH